MPIFIRAHKQDRKWIPVYVPERLREDDQVTLTNASLLNLGDLVSIEDQIGRMVGIEGFKVTMLRIWKKETTETVTRDSFVNDYLAGQG